MWVHLKIHLLHCTISIVQLALSAPSRFPPSSHPIDESWEQLAKLNLEEKFLVDSRTGVPSTLIENHKLYPKEILKKVREQSNDDRLPDKNSWLKNMNQYLRIWDRKQSRGKENPNKVATRAKATDFQEIINGEIGRIIDPAHVAKLDWELRHFPEIKVLEAKVLAIHSIYAEKLPPSEYPEIVKKMLRDIPPDEDFLKSMPKGTAVRDTVSKLAQASWSLFDENDLKEAREQAKELSKLKPNMDFAVAGEESHLISHRLLKNQAFAARTPSKESLDTLPPHVREIVQTFHPNEILRAMVSAKQQASSDSEAYLMILNNQLNALKKERELYERVVDRLTPVKYRDGPMRATFVRAWHSLYHEMLKSTKTDQDFRDLEKLKAELGTFSLHQIDKAQREYFWILSGVHEGEALPLSEKEAEISETRVPGTTQEWKGILQLLKQEYPPLALLGPWVGREFLAGRRAFSIEQRKAAADALEYVRRTGWGGGEGRSESDDRLILRILNQNFWNADGQRFFHKVPLERLRNLKRYSDLEWEDKRYNDLKKEGKRVAEEEKALEQLEKQKDAAKGAKEKED
ncbi:hypothetical protein IE53DRAFT_359812 [Violaceomyces palustris]|uniref:Uncharacterized protein n=1 Tax=Violaceomyces palustris TaxID=1673888 RepID=A0ACD0P6K0_9BASI|nr:hypothetical protein IE53DRAFT_359812 [Violaceomyces palustris]